MISIGYNPMTGDEQLVWDDDPYPGDGHRLAPDCPCGPDPVPAGDGRAWIHRRRWRITVARCFQCGGFHEVRVPLSWVRRPVAHPPRCAG